MRASDGSVAIRPLLAPERGKSSNEAKIQRYPTASMLSCKQKRQLDIRQNSDYRT